MADIQNTENAQKWIDALRSGEYQQAKGSLRKPEGFCCLGVACDVAINNGVQIEVREVISPFAGPMFVYGDEDSWLPQEVKDWLGWPEDGLSLESDLAGFNDNGVPFSEIADRITLAERV